jgi:arylsulfatase A-like enzyme
LYEGGIRAPLIARWPGKIAAGSESELVSAHWDMLPTFCEIANVGAPACDGISMMPELLGDSENQKKHEFLYWEFYERGGRRAVRFGRWKAVQNNLKSTQQVDGIEIYDLSADIGEETNIAAKNPELVKQAQDYFARAHTPSKFWRFGAKKKNKKKKKAA